MTDASSKSYTSKDLILEVKREGGGIVVLWRGKSTARDPGAFVGPILAEVVQDGAREKLPVTFDFRALEYMNSSTITPVIRILNEAKRGENRIAIVYRKDLKWQDLSFSALAIFQTDDRRIEIRGV